MAGRGSLTQALRRDLRAYMTERLELTVSLRSQNWFVLGLTSETADLLLAFPAAVVTALLPLLRKNSFAKGKRKLINVHRFSFRLRELLLA